MKPASHSGRLPQWHHPFVDVFRHFGVGTWTNSCKHGDVTQVIDPQLRQPVFRIAGAVPATNYIQIPKSTSQSVGLSGTYLYFQFKTEPPKYFVVHIDTVTIDGLVVRISFSNLFREFKATSTWLQFPFDEPSTPDVHPHSRWTLLVLNLPAIYAEHVTRVYSHVKGIRMCGNLFVRRVFASDIAYNETALPRDVALKPPSNVQWGDAFDCIRFPPPSSAAASGGVGAALISRTRRKGVADRATAKERVRDEDRDKENAVVKDSQMGANARLPSNERGNVDAFDFFAPELDGMLPQRDKRTNLPSRVAAGPLRRRDHTLSPDPIASLSLVSGIGPSCLKALLSPNSDEVVYACRAIIVAQKVENESATTTEDADDLDRIRGQRFFVGHTDAVCAMTIDANGRMLATAQGGVVPCIRLWRFGTGECLLIVATGLFAQPPTDVRLSPEGVRLCAAGKDARDRHLLCVWDVQDTRDDVSVRLVARAKTDADIACVRMQPADVNRLATCGRGSVRFWRLLHANLRPNALRLPRELISESFSDVTYEPGFRPNDPTAPRTAFVGCSTGDVLIVSLPSVTLSRIVRAHAGPIAALVACEAFLATASSGADRTLRIWPLDMSDPYVEANHATDIAAVAVGYDCMTVAVSCMGGLLGIMNVNARTYATAVRCHAKLVTDMRQHPANPALFATASKDERTVRVWSFPGLVQLVEFSSRRDPPCRLAWHPRSTCLLAVGFESGAVRIFNTRRAAQVAVCRQHSAAVASMSFSVDGTRLYTSAGDGLLAMYECVFTGIRSVPQQQDAPMTEGSQSQPPDAAFVESAELHPSSLLVCSTLSPRLAVSDEGGWVAFFAPDVEPGRPPTRTAAWLVIVDGRNMREVARMSLDRIASRGALVDLTFVNDSQEIAVLNENWDMGLLDSRTAEWVGAVYPLFRPHDGPPPEGKATAMAAAPYRNIVAVVGEDRLMRIASTKPPGAATQSFVGMGSPVTAVAFADGGRRVVAGGEAIFLWDVHADPDDEGDNGAGGVASGFEGVGGLANAHPVHSSSPARQIHAPPLEERPERVNGSVDEDDANHVGEIGERSALTMEDIGSSPAMPNRRSASPTKDGPARPTTHTHTHNTHVHNRHDHHVHGDLHVPVPSVPPSPHARPSMVLPGRLTPTSARLNSSQSPAKALAHSRQPRVAHHFVPRMDAPPLALRRYTVAESDDAGLKLAIAVGNNAMRSPQPIAWDSMSGVFVWSVGSIAVLENLSTRKQTHVTTHTAEVSAVALCPGGRTMATAFGPSPTSGAGKVCLWDLTTGDFPANVSQPRLIAALSYHDNCVTALAFSVDATRLVSVGNYSDPSVALWDAREGRFVGAHHPGRPIHAVCWCPPTPTDLDTSDDAIDSDGTRVGVALLVAVGERSILFVSADERHDGGDGPVDANEMARLQLKVMRADIPAEVTAPHFTAVCFGPYEGHATRSLFVGGSDGSVTRWDVRSRCCTSAWSADSSELDAVLWAHRRLITGGQSTCLRRWTASDALNVESEIDIDGPVVSLQTDLMGEMGIVASASGTLWYVDFGENTTIRLSSSHTGRITGADMSFDGRHMVTCAEDGSVRVWAVGRPDDDSTANGAIQRETSNASLMNAVEQIVHFQAVGQPATCTCAFPAGDRCAAGYGDGAVRVFSVQRIALETKFVAHSTSVTAIAVDAGGRFIISGSAAGIVVISSTATGITLRSISDHRGAPIACIRFERPLVTSNCQHGGNDGGGSEDDVDGSASDVSVQTDWRSSRMVTVVSDGRTSAGQPSTRQFQAPEGKAEGVIDAHNTPKRRYPKVPRVAPSTERFVVTSNDRRLSLWRCEWLHDECALEEWLTFPGPQTAGDGAQPQPEAQSHSPKIPRQAWASSTSAAARSPSNIPTANANANEEETAACCFPSLACFCPSDPNLLVYTGFGFQKELILYDLRLKKIRKTIPLVYWATSLDCSPDGSLIALGCKERLVKIVDPAEGTFQDYVGHSDAVSVVRFDAAGNRLLTAAYNALLIWDVAF